MNDYYIRAAVFSAGPDGAVNEGVIDPLDNILSSVFDPDTRFALDRERVSGESLRQRSVTVGELRQVLRTVFSDLKIYVLESDITSSQTAVRTIEEQSQF